MATPRLARSPTCLSCLRRLAQPCTPTLSPLSFTQIRGARTTKAEEEDLQGIPVRLLRDIPSFGRKHAIIRVKPGRMRNFWFPKSLAEYMTRQRFKDLGLSEAAIGVRDRTFGTKLLLEEEGDKNVLVEDVAGDRKNKKKEVLTLPPEETQSLLHTLLPEVLTFPRKPIAPALSTAPPPEPEPVIPRSPSLAVNAAASTTSPAFETTAATTTTTTTTTSAPEPGPVAIFGSVSTNDVLAVIKEKLLADAQGSRVALEAESVEIVGLEAGEDRIKHLGRFEVLISPGRELEPVRRAVEVVSEE